MRTDDPDELRYQHVVDKRDPAVAITAVEEIEVHLRYGIASLKLVAWVMVALLALILWRVW
jgi:hypothetical protein